MNMTVTSKLVPTFVLWLALVFNAGADPLSELPAQWQDRLQAIPETDISGAEPGVRETLRAARQETVELMEGLTIDKSALALSFGNLGNLYQLYNVHTLAEQCYANARGLEPGNFRWAYYAAYLALSAGRIEQAIERLGDAGRLNPDYPPLALRLGQASYELNRLDQAREQLQRAAEVPGLRAAALYYLGQIALLERNYPLAVEQLETALTIDPEASQLHYPLARAYRGIEKVEQARKQLARRGKQMPAIEDPLVLELKALEKGARRFYARGMQEVERGEYEKGVQSFRSGLAKDPDNLNARVSLARSLFLAGETEQAKTALEQVLQQAPDQRLANFLMGVLLDSRGQSEAAAGYYAAVLKRDPEHAGASFFLANQLLLNHRFEEAAIHYQVASAPGADNPFALLYQLVALRHAAEGDNKILERVEKAREQHPELQMLTYAQARLLAVSREVADPARALNLAQGLAMSFGIPPYLEALALAFAAGGDYPQAISIQNQLIAGAAWMGSDAEQARLQKMLDLFSEGRIPVDPWPEDAPMLSPQPIDASSVFREYPSPVPF